MIDHSVMQQLFALNLSPEQMQGVIAIIARQGEKELARLARKREVMRKCRARGTTVAPQEKPEQNQQSCGTTVVPQPSLFLSLPMSKIARNVPVPEGWKPNSGHYEYGAKLGFNPEQVDDVAEDVRLWGASSNKERTLRGWDATLRQFLKRNAKEKSKSIVSHRSSNLQSIF
jgi:hypothetical protein